MTHQNDYTFSAALLEDLSQQGLEGAAELIRIVLNEAMRAEREKYLAAGNYERTDERKGYTNGYKPKPVNTRVDKITFDIPQVREGGFYPSALEKGMRSERALIMTLAERYVQGESTRKVKAIMEQLCGVRATDFLTRCAAGVPTPADRPGGQEGVRGWVGRVRGFPLAGVYGCADS